MYEALKICAPITLMTFAIFTRSDMVINDRAGRRSSPPCSSSSARCGIAFAMFGRFLGSLVGDILLRCGSWRQSPSW